MRTSAEDGRGVEERGYRAVGGEQSRQAEPPLVLLADRPLVRHSRRGTVVTGSVAHGTVSREDELSCGRRPSRVRVRDLQSHHDARDSAAGRRRLALNLAECRARTCGVHWPRPDIWSRRGFGRAAGHAHAGQDAQGRFAACLHIATSEVLAELRLADKPESETVSGVFAQ